MALATFNERIFFDQTAQFLAQRANTTVFTTNDKLLLQRIVSINAVGTHTNYRLKKIQFTVMTNQGVPGTAVLLVFVKRINQC
ncbi:hypothetical protein D3C75_715550 [compost metagenome]